jgi:hypothetical protein
MKNIIVVVADLGALKAYRLGRTPLQHTPRLELLDEFSPRDAHAKLVDQVSDQAGRFRVPNASMAMAYGERDKIELERRRRLVKQLADRLKTLLQQDEITECHFAASKEIHHQLLDELDAKTRAKIVKHVHADLTKVDKSDLLGHF